MTRRGREAARSGTDAGPRQRSCGLRDCDECSTTVCFTGGRDPLSPGIPRCPWVRELILSGSPNRRLRSIHESRAMRLRYRSITSYAAAKANIF